MQPVSLSSSLDNQRNDIPKGKEVGQMPGGQEVTDLKKPSMWQKAKAFMANIWKVDLVRAIIYAVGALLAFTGMVFCACAIPFTGGSIVGLSIGVVSLTILFTILAAKAFSTFAEPSPFVSKYQDLLDKEKVNERNPDYRPSFDNFYQDSDIKALLDNESSLAHFNQRAREGFLKLKKEHEEVVKMQISHNQLNKNFREFIQEFNTLEKLTKK